MNEQNEIQRLGELALARKRRKQAKLERLERIAAVLLPKVQECIDTINPKQKKSVVVCADEENAFVLDTPGHWVLKEGFKGISVLITIERCEYVAHGTKHTATINTSSSTDENRIIDKDVFEKLELPDHLDGLLPLYMDCRGVRGRSRWRQPDGSVGHTPPEVPKC
jgi:hypothetical protein